jgi:ABC-type transport system involved in Fe-S cluster assembly fused permease/ATPase subunit
LFNCSIKENLLYGDQKASNEAIMASAKDANAAEFIENTELGDLIANNAAAIYDEISKEENKKYVLRNLDGEDEYNDMLKNLAKLKMQEA